MRLTVVESALRRTFDVGVAASVLILASPVLLTIAIAVVATSKGGAIYRAQRVGRGGKPFYMYKFRTMIANADAVGGLITRRDDPRVIPLGRWLRKTKLDELPELLNVILGDMSLVGPRPENLKSVSLYSGAQRRILETRPGLTSPATIKYRREADDLDASGDVENDYLPIMQDKLALELQYLDAGRSFVSDLQVLLGTISTLCRDALSGARLK